MSAANNSEVKKHDGRDDLAGEHRFGDLGQMILFFLFIAGILLDLLLIHSFSQVRDVIPLAYRIPISVPFFVVSFLLFQKSHRDVFGTVREKMTVINTGVYSLVRHPMYLGAITLYLAILALSLSVIAFVVWILAVAFYVYISRYEEMILVGKLGAEYEKYKLDVPMYIPRFNRKTIEK